MMRCMMCGWEPCIEARCEAWDGERCTYDGEPDLEYIAYMRPEERVKELRRVQEEMRKRASSPPQMLQAH